MDGALCYTFLFSLIGRSLTPVQCCNNTPEPLWWLLLSPAETFDGTVHVLQVGEGAVCVSEESRVACPWDDPTGKHGRHVCVYACVLVFTLKSFVISAVSAL